MVAVAVPSAHDLPVPQVESAAGTEPRVLQGAVVGSALSANSAGCRTVSSGASAAAARRAHTIRNDSHVRSSDKMQRSFVYDSPTTRKPLIYECTQQTYSLYCV